MGVWEGRPPLRQSFILLVCANAIAFLGTVFLSFFFSGDLPLPNDVS